MVNIPIPGDEWKCVDVDKSGSGGAFWARLSQIAAQSGRPYFSLLTEIAALRLGPGRLSFAEYAALRLYDRSLYGDADKKAFVGFKVLQKIWIQANYRFDHYGLVNNKIVTDILLGMHGFPIMPTVALFHDGIGNESPFVLRSEEELRGFLSKREYYPLFGKPISGHQSFGSASLDHYDAERRLLVTTTGYKIPLETFLSYVRAHAGSGYIFQRRVSPHAEVRKLCGERLATVRVLTIMTKGRPKLLRACWKIPAGTNIADNFWRPGNLLAQLDPQGRVLRVVRGSENGFEEVTHHPDTGACIVGTTVPNWQQIIALALESAKVLEEMALIGWDIAPLDSGAVIVEINETPDFKLHQLTDRRGMLDAGFKSFLAERKQHAAEWLRKARGKQKVVTELMVAPAAPSGAASPQAPPSSPATSGAGKTSAL